jgi:hypothetical protein
MLDCGTVALVLVSWLPLRHRQFVGFQQAYQEDVEPWKEFILWYGGIPELVNIGSQMVLLVSLPFNETSKTSKIGFA